MADKEICENTLGSPESEVAPSPILHQNEDFDDKFKALEAAESALDAAYNTGRAERAKITQSAQLDAAEAVAMVGIAMESDVEADDALRISVLAEKSGDRARVREARKKEREARRKAKADHKAATQSAKRAYDAIRFSAPNKMGFMRVVQVLFALHIVTTLVWLMLTSRDSMSYNVTSMMDWVMVILEGVAFWLFINRYKIARPFVIGMALFVIIVPVIFDIAMGTFNLFALVINSLFYVFLIFYFIFSPRVKSVLVNDVSMRTGEYEKDDFVVNRSGWPFVRNLIIYFIVFSIIGHWMEMAMCQFIRLGIVQGEYDPSNTMLWRDWLYPFPMEGAAVVIIALVLYPFFLWLKKKFKDKIILAYIISFLAGALLCSIIELSMGLLVNANYELWDYRDHFGNILGQVCLQNTAAFGVVAAVITWWVYPMLERWIARVPRDVMNIVFVAVAVFGALVWSLYIINPPGVDDRNLPEYKEHPELVEERYDKLSLAIQLARVHEQLDDLGKSIDETTQLDKEDLKAKVEALRVEVKAMLNEDVGYEDFPDTYQQLFYSVNEASTSDEPTSSQVSSGGSAEEASGGSAGVSAEASSEGSASAEASASAEESASVDAPASAAEMSASAEAAPTSAEAA